MGTKITITNQTILITGVAGFIGAATAKALMTKYPDCHVIGIDNLNAYYTVKLKKARLAELRRFTNFTMIKGDITNKRLINRIFNHYHPTIVIHLAAQAGVTFSVTHPENYIHDNILGFFQILEACRYHQPAHLVYASSSSVYGDQTEIPYRTDAKVDQPVSLYAATKASNELMAKCYTHLYKLHATGLRFFTVYGPMGRPDMAYFKFTKRILAGEMIELWNNGENQRDFTYIDDIVEGILRVMVLPPEEHRVLNIGKGHPETTIAMVSDLQAALQQAELLPQDYDIQAHQKLLPPQPADVVTTYADTSDLVALTGYTPRVNLRDGLQRFANWYSKNLTLFSEKNSKLKTNILIKNENKLIKEMLKNKKKNN